MQTFVITGASSGIGAAAAKQLARTRPNDRLILVGRNPERTAAVAAECGAEYRIADFSRLSDVRTLADDLPDHIDVLAHNAGGMFAGPQQTEDGFELTYQVNVVAPFLLTYLLRDRVDRVVITSSMANSMAGRFAPEGESAFKGWPVTGSYADAKLAVVDLVKFWSTHGIAAVAYHPGVVATNFGSDASPLIKAVFQGPLRAAFMTPEAGGARLAYFITGTPGIHWEPGTYYHSPRIKGFVRPWGGQRDVAGALAARLGITWE